MFSDADLTHHRFMTLKHTVFDFLLISVSTGTLIPDVILDVIMMLVCTSAHPALCISACLWFIYLFLFYSRV